jgi:photosystem II stability/assembly factor-like uncharacterized protein
MRKGKFFQVFAVGVTLLLMVSAGTYGAAVAQDPPAPGDAQAGTMMPGMDMPDIRDIGHSYDYVESRTLPSLVAIRGDDSPPRAGLSPSAIEGQPRELDWTPVRRVAVHPSNSQILYATISNGHGLYRSTSGGQFWRRLPIGYGDGWAIVFASDNTTALASFGDYSASGGVYISTDTGNTWLDVSAGIDYTVSAAAFEPGDVTRVYAATLGGGVYRGTYTPGSGVSWVQINTGLTDTMVYSIAVSPSNTDVLYAGGLNEVWHSDDGGASWTIADSTYSLYSVYNEAVAVDPDDPDQFYVGSQRLAWVLPDGLTLGGFFKSTAGPGDGNLVLKNVGMQETFVLDIAQDPHNANILYAGTWASGVFRSDDGGDTWTAKNGGLTLPYIYSIEAVPDPGNPGGTILYAANFYDGAGLFASTDRGDTWTDVSSVGLPEKFDITTTSDAYHLAAATGIGVLYSDDGGVTWYISAGLTGARDGIVLDLERDPNNSSKLLAATYGGGIWTSTDAGWHWAETSAGIGGGAYVYDVAFSSTAPNTAYAGSYGVYRTTDGGATWAPFGSVPHYVRDVDGHNGSTANLYAGTHDAGVFMSPNANGTWTAINTGLGEHRVRSLKAVASNEVFAGTNGRSAWEYDGASWTQQGPYIWAPGVIQIAIHPTNPAIIYAATDQGVYRSTDHGETWTPRNKGLGGYGDLVVSGISIDPNNPEIVYIGTWGYGVFKWDIPNQRWERLSDPLKSSTTLLPLVLRNYSAAVPLVNGDFEQGPVGWGQYSEQGWSLILPSGGLLVPPHSGDWAVWLGGDVDEFAVIWQDATVPAADPWLRFYHWDASEDICGFDYGYVYINAGSPYESWQLCDANDTNGWVWKSVNLSAYAGQTVEIAIAVSTDSSLNSNLFVDDVTLGSTRLADFSTQEELRVLDPALSKRGLLPDPRPDGESMHRQRFLPLP